MRLIQFTIRRLASLYHPGMTGGHTDVQGAEIA